MQLCLALKEGRAGSTAVLSLVGRLLAQTSPERFVCFQLGQLCYGLLDEQSLLSLSVD